MTAMTHDLTRERLTAGLGFAMVSAASFGLSGSLARGLLDVGWSAGAATLVRVAIAAAVLLVPAIIAVRGRGHLVRRGWKVIVAYGLFAVAGAQLCYFLAVGYLDVSVALLIEYTAPVAVVLWMWLRHGHRPTPLTVGGAAIAAFGLALLLNVFGGGQISIVGVLWALAAMVGASVYFIIGGDESNGLPPITLAAGGLLVALVALGAAGVTGVLPMRFSTGTVSFVQFDAPWWSIAIALGVITAAVAYVTGIAATRRLGARLGSFVALTEVMAATAFAWLLLGQAPAPIQAGGALLILAGVIVVKLGERPAATVAESIVEEPALTDPPAPVPV
ncbi:EamA family transporter [Demequina muriae]|uniref:DMT family transporter n=1 Tax=Demequina muriae TaxID=3051664 RepID=A0ABT8GEY4_9MICO|nr:DMT family transporter [Demequina sp. EGI L300058]MDN4479998.1 DMT family transporter [Demequina sp. EGI L300058]